LGAAVLSFEFFMKAWERLAEQQQYLKPFINIGLTHAMVYYNYMQIVLPTPLQCVS
ncbi:hypothetical protein PAXRUDRAFT_157673, partial [Paxillus rubicundulus Ve08.2h10]